MVFDVAKPGAFEHRLMVLDALRATMTNPAIQIIRHQPLWSDLELDMRERDIVASGGEGCVIRRPGHLYRPGRSGDVIKVKRLVGDVERWQG
jgi:ATP-dependent DNA ligase